MYEDIGTKTCGGYPGLYCHEQKDVDTFAEWEIDYLKVDGCYMDEKRFEKRTFQKILPTYAEC